MSVSAHPAMELRPIRPDNMDLVQTFFDQLDEDCLAARFGMQVTREFLQSYAQRLGQENATLIGAFEAGQLLGLAELHILRPPGLTGPGSADVELALVVDQPCQSQGIGTTLAAHAIEAASTLLADEIHACFNRNNRRMELIARKLGMRLFLESDFVIASLALARARSS